MNKNIKTHSVCIRITLEESKMVETLRDKHCVNISKFIRRFIRETFKKMEMGNEKNIFTV